MLRSNFSNRSYVQLLHQKYLCIFTFYSRFILDLAPLRQFINKLLLRSKSTRRQNVTSLLFGGGGACSLHKWWESVSYEFHFNKLLPVLSTRCLLLGYCNSEISLCLSECNRKASRMETRCKYSWTEACQACDTCLALMLFSLGLMWDTCVSVCVRGGQKETLYTSVGGDMLIKTFW